jgi:hypothetical protein
MSDTKEKTSTYGEMKRGEIIDLIGIDPGDAYPRIMDGIRQRAIENFKKKQEELKAQRENEKKNV